MSEPISDDSTPSRGTPAAGSRAPVPNPPVPNPPDPSSELAEVRRILVGPEQAKIEGLEDKTTGLESKTEDQRWQMNLVAKVIPQAVALRMSKDKQLARALAPTIEQSLRDSIRKDPSHIVDAISPVMGPAIRKSIADTLQGFLLRFNSAVSDSFTVNGAKRRLRSWRTGIPYAELVMLETLHFVPKQAFLIHRQTGLLLLHTAAAGLQDVQDADTVSGMFTAIRDFVKESFKGDEQGLNDIRMGDTNIVLEQGRSAFIAVAVRGTPTTAYRARVEEVVERIHADFAPDLDSFTGDAGPLAPARILLDELLEAGSGTAASDTAPRRKLTFAERLRFWFGPGLIALLLPVAIAFAAYFWWWVPRDEQLRFNTYVDRINSTPGMAVTYTKFDGGSRWSLSDDKWTIIGRVDPDVRPLPTDDVLLGEAKGLLIESRWEQYLSLDPTFVKARAARVLAPLPAGLTLTSDRGVLKVAGRASHQWILRARRNVQNVVGISSLDESALINTDLESLKSIRERIEEKSIRFTFATSDLVPGQEATLNAATEQIFKLYDAARTAGIEFTIQVVGHTDSSGQEERNIRLSRDRADRVISLLVSRGVRTRELAAVGVGFAQPRTKAESTDKEREQNRRASLRVLFLQQPLFLDDPARDEAGQGGSQ